MKDTNRLTRSEEKSVIKSVLLFYAILLLLAFFATSCGSSTKVTNMPGTRVCHEECYFEDTNQ